MDKLRIQGGKPLSGEVAIAGADAASLAAASNATLVGQVTAMPAAIAATARDGDVVIVMGAGSIGAVPAQTVELLK